MLEHRYSFQSLGTQWHIDTEAELEPPIKERIQHSLEQFDSVYSRFRADSLVSQVAVRAGEYIFPENAKQLFGLYKQLYELSGGKVTPLIGDMMSRAGYDATYSLQPQAQKQLPVWDEAMHWDGVTLQTKLPVLLDVGAAGKGLMVDELAKLLEEHAIHEYVIDASGDMRHKGQQSNKVGLEHPLDAAKVIGVVEVQNKSMCASASNRRAWGNGLHHIFDPHEMKPTHDIIATWVVADDAMVADGLATALFFVEPAILAKQFDYDFVRMHANGAVEYSAYFEGALY